MIDSGQMSLQKRFRSYLSRNGFSYTSQRRLILREVLRSSNHFDVEELVDQIRRRSVPVSRATVYRTLSHLESSGFIHRVELDQNHAHYEVAALHHEHLICEGCGKIVEFSDAELEEGIETVAREHDFTVSKHTIFIMGLCDECRNVNQKEDA